MEHTGAILWSDLPDAEDFVAEVFYAQNFAFYSLLYTISGQESSTTLPPALAIENLVRRLTMTVASLPPLPEIPNVEVRHVFGFTGYAIGTNGKVFGCRKAGPGGYFYPSWRPLTPHLQGNPRTVKYPSVVLSRNGSVFNRSVHILLLTTFIGPCPEGMEACHNDGNSHNSTLSNLRWGTPESNWADRRRHGRSSAGEGNGQAKVSHAAVEEIRRLAIMGTPRREIRERFFLSKAQVRRIITYESWREIDHSTSTSYI